MQHRIPLTPAAWSNWLTYEKPSQERQHQHNLILVADPSQPVITNSDKENQHPQVQSNSLHLLCLICHGRFIVSITSQLEADSRTCTGTDYKTHHFHQDGNSDRCCGCDLQVTWEYRDPLLAMSVIESMSDTRKVNISYADHLQGQAATAPTVASALATILVYIRDMLTGVRRNINIQNKSFVIRIGADSASTQLFGTLGFKLEENMLVSTLGNAPEDELLLQIVRQEIEATLASIRSPHGYLSIPDESIVPHFESAIPALETFLAGQYDRRAAKNSTISTDEEFSLLGGVPDMADNVIVWLYKLLVNEQPQNHSGWLDALEKIAQGTKSEELQTEVAIEHSQGVFGFTDVTRAYQHFDLADPQNVDDDLILGLYDVKMTDEPANAKHHLDMLRVIANHRKSDKLFHLLTSVSDYERPKKSNVDKNKNASDGSAAPFTAEAAFSETKKVWQMATNRFKSEVSHAKDMLMEYSSSPPIFSLPAANPSSAISHHHVYLPGNVGMFALSSAPMHYSSSETTKSSKKPSQPISKSTTTDSIKSNHSTTDVTISDNSSILTEKRSIRSNSTASIASLAVAKYSSAVNAISNAVAPATLAATNALANLSNLNMPPYHYSPVGLNNIGNTCYLNSLLQYYFTLKELRDTVLDMDMYVEHEDDPEWQEKRIGGIKVGHNEVRLAKQFVTLLRELFLNLTHTHQLSIAPQENLAYMALTSADEIANSTENFLAPITAAQPSSNDTSLLGPVNTETGKESNIKKELEAVAEEEETATSDSQGIAEVPEAMDILTEESTPGMTDENIPSDADAQAPSVQETDMSESDNMKVDEEDKDTSSTDLQLGLDEPAPSPPDEFNHVSSQLRSTPSTETLATTGSQATINEAVDIPPLPERRPVPSPPAYPATEGKGKITESTNPFESTVRAQDPSKMLFGRQQDVTECMGNCMYFFEAALRPSASDENASDEKTDLVKELFYGKARQILSYNNEETNQLVTKIKEEEFSHLIVDAAEGKNLYDGLDEYFFADDVDDYQGGNCAVREVAVTQFPPILQVQVQRVQFDRRSARVYKSNAFVQFDETIYLDRYLDSNFETLADRRKRVTECRKEIDTYKADITELTENKKYPMPVAEMLEITTKILQDNQANSSISTEDHEKVMRILEEEINAVKSKISDRESRIESLIKEVSTKYDDLQECKYQLHAVFIHQGQANYGHYWIYIRDHVTGKWWKYNDTNVSEVNETEIFKDTTGSTANPYFLVYVRSSDLAKHVMTICRKKLSQ